MKKYRFTLIEILGVIALIAILGVIGFAGYSYANNAGKESATKSLQARLTAALETAKNKSGSLPISAEFVKIQIDTNNEIVTFGTKTFAKSAVGANKYQQEFYKTFIKTIEMDSMNRFLSDNTVIDAWGNPVYYRYPGANGGIELVSAGEDGKFGTDNADTPPASISSYKDGEEMTCDDIVTF